MDLNDEDFDLSDDFFDALSVLATNNADYADAQQQQQPTPQVTTQCLIEEQQQRAQVATQQPQMQFAPPPPQSAPQLQQQPLSPPQLHQQPQSPQLYQQPQTPQLQYQPQSVPQLQQQQINFQQQQQQQQLLFRQQQQQQMMQQQVGYQQCERPLAPQISSQQQSMIQQQQRILAAYQQQQQQQQYQSSTPSQNQPLQAPRNFVPQQQQQCQSDTQQQQRQSDKQQQMTAQQQQQQQRLFLQQQQEQQQYQRPQLQQSQLQKEQSHALQLASQLQYQRIQVPTSQTQQPITQQQQQIHLQKQQPQNRQSVSPLQYQQAQVQNQQTRAIQLASQLQNQPQLSCQSVQLPIRNNQPQIQNQQLQVQNQQLQIQNLKQTIQNQQLPVPVSQLQQQTIVAVRASQLPQIQQQLQNNQPVQAQLPISQPQTQQPILQPSTASVQLTTAQQRLLAAHQQQQQQQKQQQQAQNLSLKHRKPVAPQNTFPTVSQQQNAQPATTTTTTSVTERVTPHIEIVEQPAPRASRFRYNCEVRDSGSIPGVNSTPNTKTYPTIRIVGYNGNAKVVVSCVTKDPPYRPHPHNLVGKSWCKNGICTTALTSHRMSVTFDRLGIQCIKRKDFPASLEQREKQQVDPFGTGFGHKEKERLASIDQNCVRLAFQAFLEGPKKGEFKISLPAVVSDPIHDKKNSPDLTIHKISHCSAPADGDQQMILLCDRVTKEDIQIRFYEERDEEVVWEKFVDVSRTGVVHKYVAIVFKCPRYRELDFCGTVQVKVELIRPSDGMYSNSLKFEFTPDHQPIVMQKKRKRLHESIAPRDVEAANTYSDQWSAMSHSNFNIIEAR